jgi:hypothetical protein
VIVWPDRGYINFWRKDDYSCIGTLHATPDTIIPDAEQVFHRLKAEGLDLLRIVGRPDPARANAAGRPADGPIGFFVPETIQYFEDGLPEAAERGQTALTVCQMPFYLDDDEKADFKHALMQRTPKNDWLEFAPDLSGAFRSARGHYGFRKSTVIDMFANSKSEVLAIQTTDKYRSFVPMTNPQNHIDAVAREVQQLTKADAPATAYPLYFDPAIHPPGKRNHINIVLRR